MGPFKQERSYSVENVVDTSVCMEGQFSFIEGSDGSVGSSASGILHSIIFSTGTNVAIHTRLLDQFQSRRGTVDAEHRGPNNRR